MRRSFLLLPALGALFLYACADSNNSGDDDDFLGGGGTESSGTSGASGTKGGSGGKSGAAGKGGSAAGKGGSDAGQGGTSAGTSAGTGQASVENTDELCSDGKDNDDNGFADCGDINCVNSPDVTVCKQGAGGDPFGGGGTSGSGENTVALCTDGKDNDGNKYIDCNDKGCCGIVDCSDEPASYCGKGNAGGSSGGTKENTAALCKDGKDNDGDGFKDCDDYDCCDLETCGSTTACGKQGGTGGSGGSSSGKENTVALCSDGKDNDGDKFIDCDDYDCCDVASCSTTKPQSKCATKGTGGSGGTSSGTKEATLALCTDGTDNDGDSFVDCDDYDCCTVANCKTTKPQSKCATKGN